jgi:anti-anti-sigma factor
MAEEIQVVRPRGRLDNSTSPEFEKDLLGRVDRGAALLVLDLSDLAFMSSTGLRAILLTAKRLKLAGGRLAVCALSKPVKQVFEVTGCDALIDIFPSYETAVAHLSMR